MLGVDGPELLQLFGRERELLFDEGLLAGADLGFLGVQRGDDFRFGRRLRRGLRLSRKRDKRDRKGEGQRMTMALDLAETRDVLLAKVFPRRAQVIDTATLRGLLSP